jgi:hypothetical protein
MSKENIHYNLYVMLVFSGVATAVRKRFSTP